MNDNWPVVEHTVGMLIPATNTAVEVEVNRVLPRTFQVHIGRLRVGSVDARGFAEQDADVDYQAQLLGTIAPAIIVFLQTSASLFIDGYDADVTSRISNLSGVPSTTTALAMLEALDALDATRVALVSPYSPEVSASARDYLERGGFDVTAVEGLNVTDPNTITGLKGEHIASSLVRAAQTDADVLIVAGGAFHGMPLIHAWEQRFQRPVITTNQLAIWACMRAIPTAEPVTGFGQLLHIPQWHPE